MTDAIDFEARLQSRLLAHTAGVVRPFDAAAISASAAAAARARRTWGARAGWRSYDIGLTPLVAALLLLGLLVALIAGLLLAGSRPTLPAVVAPTSSAIPATASALPATAAPTFGRRSRLSPTGYPGTGTIVFAPVDPSSGGDATWLIDPNGSHESALRVVSTRGGAIPLAGSGCCAVISPDGRSIAVGYDEVNPTRGPGTWATTRILKLDGSDLTSIPGFCGGCGSINRVNYLPRAWSPNGQLLAVEVWSEAEPARDGINLAPTCAVSCGTPGYVCADHGCDWATQVTGSHRDVPVAFSPDGTKLLFVRISHDRLGTLMVLSLAPPTSGDAPALPGGVRQISPAGMLVFADGSLGPAASWAPDGSRIAFAATDASGDIDTMRAYVVASAGGSPIALTAAASSLSTAKWSPDGRWIAFDHTSPGTEYHDLYIIRPDGTSETNLTTYFDPGVCCARWSPDSAALLAAGTDTENASDLLIVPISGGPFYEVTTVPGPDTDFSWGPASR